MDIGTIRPIKIEDEMQDSYLDYAMSVIISRALPDVRDGLKPVHRRILYAMHELGLHYNTPYKKSARIVGEVLGKFHPHGDTAVYDAMVRLAQDFSMRYPLIAGQGNFGSVDGDPPAAMRYTEAKLAEIAREKLVDIEKETVTFVSNFDDSLQEPTVLPAVLPNLLVNGSSGIAVGMATNIPPHNLNEVCDGVGMLIDNPEATIDELSVLIKGPDFPTGGIIQGLEGFKQAYSTGQGKVVVRAKAHIEETSAGRVQIIVTELPYQTNKATLVEKIADLARAKKIEGISELRDESDREGMRILIELRKDAQAKSVLNNLYKHTSMQSSFFVNMVALVQGQPRLISLKVALQSYIDFRREVVTLRSKFDLKKAKDRAHILEGLKTALDYLDQVIATIRNSQNAEAARTNLMRGFKLSQLQAQAILDMQLRRLAALERKKIEDEYTEVLKTIAYLEDLLANPKKIDFVIKEEILALKKKYGDERRTQISAEGATDFALEDLIPHESMVITISQRGYVKRVPLNTYRLQLRGGRGVTGMVTREEDTVRHLVVADTHDSLLFFTNKGKVYHLKCHELPGDSTRTAKGLPAINLISMEQNEQVTTVVAVRSFTQGDFMVMATRLGEVKKTAIEEFSAVRSNGLIAMDLEHGDQLVSARLVGADDMVVPVTRKGMSIKFAVNELRQASRQSGGVRGIRLSKGDYVVGFNVVREKETLCTVTANGFGKCSYLEDYPLQSRGGTGVKTHVVNSKTGDVAGSAMVSASQEIMMISETGVVIRMTCQEIPKLGRGTQGVILKRLEDEDEVSAVAVLEDRAPDKAAPAKEE